MVSIFRSYHPAVIFLLLLYVALFRISLFVGSFPFVPPASSNYLSALTYELLSIAVGNKNYIYHIVALLLVFLQALYFNYIVNRYRILSKSSYLSAMAYALLSSLVIEFTFLTPALMANTFLLFALSTVLSIYKKDKAASSIFDAGLLISIASLFFFPYLAFSFFLLASIVLLRPFNLREYILMLVGLAIPYYFIGVYFFWNHNLVEFWKTLQITRLNFPVQQIEKSTRVIVIGGVLLFVILWSLYYVQANRLRVVVQVRSYLTVFMLLFVAGILSMLVEFNGEFFHFAWMALPVGLSFAIFFMEARRRWFAEILHFFLLLSVLFFQYYFLIK